MVFESLILQHILRVLQLPFQHLCVQLQLGHLVPQILNVERTLAVVRLRPFFGHPLEHHRVLQVCQIVFLQFGYLVVQPVIAFCDCMPVSRRILLLLPSHIQRLLQLPVLLSVLLVFGGQLLACCLELLHLRLQVLDFHEHVQVFVLRIVQSVFHSREGLEALCLLQTGIRKLLLMHSFGQFQVSEEFLLPLDELCVFTLEVPVALFDVD